MRFLNISHTPRYSPERVVSDNLNKGVVDKCLLPLGDIIGWDVRNWSNCLGYWAPWLEGIKAKTARVLVLGERNGGISLWFGLLGYNVLCTDYRPVGEPVRQLHSRWRVQERIQYASADVFNLDYPDDHFDVAACKSVIGGLSLDYKDASTRSLGNQKLAANEIRRTLKPGGMFPGAENLTGTAVHIALRKARTKGRLGWRYLRMAEVQRLFDNYSQCEQKPYGFVGTYWPNVCGLNSLCAAVDACLSSVLPANWLYISFIRARK